MKKEKLLIQKEKTVGIPKLISEYTTKVLVNELKHRGYAGEISRAIILENGTESFFCSPGIKVINTLVGEFNT